MKFSFVLLIALACGTVQAQQQPVPCLSLSKVVISNHAVRQQEDTVVRLTFKARNCAIAELRDDTEAIFESLPGLDVTVSEVGFKHTDEGRVATGVVKARELSLSLKLSASPDLAVGEHTLHGLLTYQVMDGSGNPAPEALVISFPFKVIPHKPYKKVALPDYGRPHQDSAFVHGLKTAGMVIVLIPVVVFMLVWCPFSGTCPTC
jgi:hypothetical protein